MGVFVCVYAMNSDDTKTPLNSPDLKRDFKETSYKSLKILFCDIIVVLQFSNMLYDSFLTEGHDMSGIKTPTLSEAFPCC